MSKIESLQNPKIKELVRLRTRRYREKSKRFLIEGYREVSRAQAGGVKLYSLFYCPEFFLGDNEQALLALLAQNHTSLYLCTPAVFKKISYRDRPDGLLACAEQKHLYLSDIKCREGGVYVVAEAIEKPGNLGTILRSCDAVNIDALLVADPCTDIFNPNVVRASVGTLFTQKIIECSSEETLHWCQEKGIQTVAVTPYAKTLYTDISLTGSIALAVGTEQYGLSPIWMEGAGVQARLPMLGKSDSLNVAMATVVLLYEVIRQRNL